MKHHAGIGHKHAGITIIKSKAKRVNISGDRGIRCERLHAKTDAVALTTGIRVRTEEKCHIAGIAGGYIDVIDKGCGIGETIIRCRVTVDV